MYRSYPGTDPTEPSGGYDRLYASRDFLWPERPGRMVRKAVMLRRAGRVLEAGCGDGKNLAFLLAHGWTADAFDISALAVEACRRRLAGAGEETCRIWRDDSRVAILENHAYDMVVAYGLYHCLDDAGLHQTHRRLVAALKPGGLFVCAAFNDALPLPVDHATGSLFLRAKGHLNELFLSWVLVDFEMGVIEEDHSPLVGRHRHSLTWAIYGKVT
jgi:SAM-dependent methyltransferase